MAVSSAAKASKDQELISELKALYIEAKNRKQEKYANWERNYRMVRLSQQLASNSWAPSPRDSEIYPTLSSMVAWLTDQETIIEFAPAVPPGYDVYPLQAQMCNDLEIVTASNWEVEDYDAQIKLGLWDAFIYGIGIFRADWDDSLAGGKGNAILRRVDPWRFYPDPNATSMDDAEYFVEVSRMSIGEIERRYPGNSATLEAVSITGGGDDDKPNLSRPGFGQPMSNPGGISGAATRYSLPSGRQAPRNPSGLVTVYQFWVKENEDISDDDAEETHVVPVWKCYVLANDCLLLQEDAEEIYPFKTHPYERYVFDDIGEFYGIALVDHLASPQLYINRLLTAYQHNTELTGNPVLIESKTSGTTRTPIINKPGQRISVDGPAGMSNKPEWLQPPSMPAAVMDLIQFWISRIENVSGLSAIVRGATPTARNAEGVISSIQESAFVRIRSALRNLEKTEERLSRKLADLIINNYSEERFIGILGNEGQKIFRYLRPNHFLYSDPRKPEATPLQYVLNVRGGSTFPTSRQARIAESDKLYAMGAIDRRAVLEAHQYPNIPQVLARIAEQTAMGAFNPPGARQRAGRST